MQGISIIQTALPVFVALFLGMLCRRTGFLNRNGIDALKKVVVNLTLPAVLLQAFATAAYSASTVAVPVVVYGMCTLALMLGFLVIRFSKMNSRLAPFLASGFEAGMLGYALFSLLFGTQHLSDFAILDIGHTLFVFTLYKILLSGKTDWKAIGQDVLTTPVLWAVILGVLIGATGLYAAMDRWGVSGVFDEITGFVGAPTGMIILLTVGFDLVPKEIPWKKTVGLIVMRLAIMALFYSALVWINRTLLNSMLFEGAILLLAILPPPYIIPVFADEPKERVQISSALSAMTLVTIVLFAVLSIITSITA